MFEKYNFDRMRRLSADIRIQTIRALAEAGYGHVGGCMSIADVLGALYGGIMRIRPEEPDWPDRDFFVLSKGHCGPALYAALALRGFFPLDELTTLNRGGTSLPSHCDRLKTRGVDVSTGSLGQGISVGEGIAYANSLRGSDAYTYCVIGDGECQEGQVWEAADLAVQLELGHFIVFVDDNKKQLDGSVEAMRGKRHLADIWRAFGWHVQTVEGWDVCSIANGVDCAKAVGDRPSLIILDTCKGLGANFAEKAEFNHYMTITHEMAEAAIAEIEKRLCEGTYPRGDVRW